MNSPYARQLGRGVANLRFGDALEREFAEFYTTNNAPRGRLSSLIALVIVLGMSATDVLTGGLTSGSTLSLIKIGVLCPLLTLGVIALHLKSLEPHYSRCAAFGVFSVGFIVAYMSVAASAGGASYMIAGTMIVTLFAGLLLGLMFYHGVIICTALAATHVVIGSVLNLRIDELLHATAMLFAVVLISSIAAYYREHAVRLHFLEKRLLNELAERDGLTGLYNRRIFDTFMRRVWRQSRREETAVQIVLIDIDHFKIYNDLYGHQSGDETLQRVARCISAYAKRPFDFCARYGGEEFVLVVYDPPHDFARSIPEQIRLDVMDLAIPHEGSNVSDRVTVSIGVAVARPGSGRSLVGAIQAADEALYQAKRNGRNCVFSKDATICDVETGRFRAAVSEIA